MAKKIRLSEENKDIIDAICEKHGIRREKQRCAVKEYISRQLNGRPWGYRPAYGIGRCIENEVIYREFDYMKIANR